MEFARKMKSTQFDAILKLSFVSYNDQCFTNDDMLSYDRYTDSLMIKNRETGKNNRFNNIQLSHIQTVQYFIGNDNDEFEIIEESVNTKSRLISSNKSYLRLKRDVRFSNMKKEWYDVIFRPRCTLDLTVFMFYLKELVHKSTEVEEVDSHYIVSKHVKHLEDACRQTTGGSETLITRQKDKVLFNYPNNKVDKKIPTISIYNTDLQCLNPRIWLNDKILHLYFTMLKDQYNNEEIHVMDCLFYTMLEKKH